MKGSLLLAALFVSLKGLAQVDTSASLPVRPVDTMQTDHPVRDYTIVFTSPKLINANTVELTAPGVLEFKVTHNFGDIAGKDGGIKNFFGLDNAFDVRIGFQYGVSKNVNIIAAHDHGASLVQQQYEAGIKIRMMRQVDNVAGHPFSMSLFANNVISVMPANILPDKDNSYHSFSDRLSQTVQLMIARKFKALSLQLSPTLVHTNYVVPHDQNTLFAIGLGARWHLKTRYSLIFDYFHTFRSKSSIDFFKPLGTHFYDAMGIGLEILTGGHVFHLNFTNATELLENRFIRRTTTSWAKGQFRWGFTISRDFNLLGKKRR